MRPVKNERGAMKELYQADSEVLKKQGTIYIYIYRWVRLTSESTLWNACWFEKHFQNLLKSFEKNK